MLHSLFPKAHLKFLSMPLLGLVADSLDDWLAANGYTRNSREYVVGRLPHVDADPRSRQVKKVADLTPPVLHDCWRTLSQTCPGRAKVVRTLERYLAADGLISRDRPATVPSPASILIEEYGNYLREVPGFASSTVSNHRYTAQCFLQHLEGKEIVLEKIQAGHLESYVAQTGKPLSRGGLQQDIGALRGFLRFLAMDGRVPAGLGGQRCYIGPDSRSVKGRPEWRSVCT